MYVPLYPESDGNIVLKQKVPVSHDDGVDEGVGVIVVVTVGVRVLVGVTDGVGVGV